MGTGPSSHSPSVWRICFINCFVGCKKFEGNFRMALCAFGGVMDQCGATSCAAQETGMVP